MKNAYNDGLIPIVTFRQPNCPPQPPPQAFPGSVWGAQLQGFVSYMTQAGLPKPLPMTYFEIGNEFNADTLYGGGYPGNQGSCNNCDYPTIFSLSALDLSTALDQRNGNSSSPYRILTAGMLVPSASTGCQDFGHKVNISLAYNAISNATAYPYYVPQLRVGVAVHPYSYDTYEPYGNYWKNFYHEYGVFVQQVYATEYNGYSGQCADLGSMINLWNSANYFNGLPIVFTEENWASYPCTYGSNTPSGVACGYYCSSTAGCEGTFLADLFTWLADHNGYAQSTSPLRVLWFTGIDFPVGSTGLTNTNGIYGMPATNTSPPREKSVTVNTCPQYANYIQGQHNLSGDYYSLSSGGYCY